MKKAPEIIFYNNFWIYSKVLTSWLNFGFIQWTNSEKMFECWPCSFFKHSDSRVGSMTFGSKVALPFLHVLPLELWSRLSVELPSESCKCQVTTLWLEFINTASVFAPVYLAGGWGKEEQLKVCSAPTELKAGAAQSVLSTHWMKRNHCHHLDEYN